MAKLSLNSGHFKYLRHICVREMGQRKEELKKMDVCVILSICARLSACVNAYKGACKLPEV